MLWAKTIALVANCWVTCGWSYYSCIHTLESKYVLLSNPINHHCRIWGKYLRSFRYYWSWYPTLQKWKNQNYGNRFDGNGDRDRKFVRWNKRWIPDPVDRIHEDSMFCLCRERNMTIVGKNQGEVLFIISSPFFLTPVLVGCGNALWKNYALWKFFSKCVKFGTKSTHFEKNFQSALNLGST